jgi:WD40 repeat protein
MDVSGNVVAVCCQQRRSVVVISLNNERPELRAQLRQTPKDASELSDGEFVTPAEGDDDLFILNEIKLSQKRVPVACAWSKYTDVLVLASSDNLLSIWNISSRSIETVAVGDESVVIRNVKFISDVVVAVALNDGIVLVDVDEGVLYEADKHSSGPGSKCASLDCVMLKGGNKVLVARPAHARLDRWKVGL